MQNDKGTLRRKVASIDDTLRTLVGEVKEQSSTQTLAEAQLKDLVKRKLASFSTIKAYRIVKGAQFDRGLVKEVAVLTSEMLLSGDWKTAAFKKYNFNAKGVIPDGGHLHPLLKVREQFRNIFLEMGYDLMFFFFNDLRVPSFSEMPTNNFVESSFWNFDTLFQPQQHPARDAHDTFFIKGALYFFGAVSLCLLTPHRPRRRDRVPARLP